MKKIILLKKDEAEKYSNDNITKDINIVDDINEQTVYRIFNTDYDIYVLVYNSDKNELNDLLNIIYDKVTKDNIELIIYNDIKDIQYEDEYMYVLAVGTGSYEDYYEKHIGIFKSRYEAKKYYKENYEITPEQIEKINEEYYTIASNEPSVYDFINDEGELDGDSYSDCVNEYWSKYDNIEYVAEDERTTLNIYKLRLNYE